jgi:aerobic carbon-monoxide dehydrogenase medium subunit
MLPAGFDYVRPSTLPEAVQILAQRGDEGKLLAGGQSLIPLLKLRFALPDVLIDISRLPNMSYVRVDGANLLVGAGTRHASVAASPVAREHAPTLAAAAPQIADPIVRNWGTIGGSLVHADPAGDLGSVMIACDAVLVAQSTRGERTMRAREFFQGPFTTALASDEILVEIRIPLAQGRVFGSYSKLERKIGDFATVGVAVCLDMDDGMVRTGGIGLTAVGATNLEATEAEEALQGRRLDGETIEAVARLSADAADPTTDLRGSADYKRDVVRVYVQRALQQAAAHGGMN